MDIRQLAPDHAVSPQIAREDVARIREAGFDTLICNRPDAEVPQELGHAEMRRLAEAEGLRFHYIPVTHQSLTPETVAAQRDACDGPTLAYCASGTRSSIVWALGQAGERDADEIVAAGAQHGYDLRPYVSP